MACYDTSIKSVNVEQVMLLEGYTNGKFPQSHPNIIHIKQM